MNAESDMVLVRDYVREGSEPAFETLVSRHVDLVYSVAFRHACDASQAEEISQAVFVILSRKASQLRSETILPAWLYETARLTSISFKRATASISRTGGIHAIHVTKFSSGFSLGTPGAHIGRSVGAARRK